MTMRSFVARMSRVAVAVAVISGFSATASAQTISTFNGTTSEQWSAASNWSPSGVLSGTGAYALINSQTSSVLRLLYTSSTFATAPAVPIGAIHFLPTLANTSGTSSGTFNVQNNSAGTKGTLRLYGIDTTVDGISSRFILINSSTLTNVQFTQSNAGQDFELFTNGAIHVTAGTQLTVTSLIRNGTTTPQSITKTGQGVLSFSGGSQVSDMSTYSGGFTLDGGIVQWALSGTAFANTSFGTGPLTLKSGTLRSTTSTGRSINTNVILDGTTTFGSTVSSAVTGTFTGNITVNSSAGALATTVASDSVISIVAGGSTAWNQSVSGVGSIAKTGPGLLRFTSLSTLTHTGSTVVQAGALSMNGNLASAGAVTVLSGATLTGTGSIAGATSILSGGTLSPGNVGGAIGLLTFGSGGLTLGGQTLMEITGTTRGVDYDAINLGGAVNYGGSLSLQVSGSLPYGDYSLFSAFTSQGGSFATISLSGFYTGSLTEAAGVWTGNVGGQDFTFTNATGVLSVVPEPSAWLLGIGGFAAGAFRTWRRSRRRPRRPA